jgi:hypothetical protein
MFLSETFGYGGVFYRTHNIDDLISLSDEKIASIGKSLSDSITITDSLTLIKYIIWFLSGEQSTSWTVEDEDSTSWNED